jgi:hypothetical protein
LGGVISSLHRKQKMENLFRVRGVVLCSICYYKNEAYYNYKV